MRLAYEVIVRLVALVAAGLAAVAMAAFAHASPDLRIFVVDAGMFANMRDTARREAFDLIVSDIRMLSSDAQFAPSQGSVLVYPARGISGFDFEEKTGAVDASLSKALTEAIDRALKKAAGSGLDLVALRAVLLRILDERGYAVAAGGQRRIAIHIFANEWRTGGSQVQKISAATDGSLTVLRGSRRPTQCFVNDLGAAGLTRSPWPDHVIVEIEVRPPHRLPTPSETSLANLIGVITLNATDVPFGRSLGIAGPNCPPGSERAPTYTSLGDPAECDRLEADEEANSRIDVCRPAATILQSTSAALVRRPLNLVAVDGDGVAASLTVRQQATPASLAPAFFLGAQSLDPTGPVDLIKTVGAAGYRLPLRVSLSPSGASCGTPQSFSAGIDLRSTGSTSAVLVTGPVDCNAAGVSGGMTFDLFEITVN